MNKSAVGNAALIITSIALALLLCEMLVRVFNLAPEIVYVEKWRVRLSDNPKIGYEPIPNLDSRGKSAQYYSYIGRSNKLGFRDYNHPVEKASGSKRVVVVGDSVTAGLWIKGDENVFTAVMEKALNKKGLKSDVMNFGVSGYNTSQEVETLKTKALPYSPDLVIVAYCLNDRFQDDGNIYGLLLAEERKNASGGKINTSNITQLERRSALIRFLRYVVIGVETGATRINHQSEVDKFYVDTVEDSFTELQSLAQQHQFEVLIAVFPNFGERDEGLRNPYSHQDEHDKVAAMSAQHGFHHLDLRPAFRDCKEKLPRGHMISFDRYHPNIAGNRCAGQVLAEQARQILNTP